MCSQHNHRCGCDRCLYGWALAAHAWFESYILPRIDDRTDDSAPWALFNSAVTTLSKSQLGPAVTTIVESLAFFADSEMLDQVLKEPLQLDRVLVASYARVRAPTFTAPCPLPLPDVAFSQRPGYIVAFTHTLVRTIGVSVYTTACLRDEDVDALETFLSCVQALVRDTPRHFGLLRKCNDQPCHDGHFCSRCGTATSAVREGCAPPPTCERFVTLRGTCCRP